MRQLHLTDVNEVIDLPPLSGSSSMLEYHDTLIQLKQLFWNMNFQEYLSDSSHVRGRCIGTSQFMIGAMDPSINI